MRRFAAVVRQPCRVDRSLRRFAPTRWIGPLVAGEKRICPSTLHAPPLPCAAAATMRGCPRRSAHSSSRSRLRRTLSDFESEAPERVRWLFSALQRPRCRRVERAKPHARHTIRACSDERVSSGHRARPQAAPSGRAPSFLCKRPVLRCVQRKRSPAPSAWIRAANAKRPSKRRRPPGQARARGPKDRARRLYEAQVLEDPLHARCLDEAWTSPWQSV